MSDPAKDAGLITTQSACWECELNCPLNAIYLLIHGVSFSSLYIDVPQAISPPNSVLRQRLLHDIFLVLLVIVAVVTPMSARCVCARGRAVLVIAPPPRTFVFCRSRILALSQTTLHVDLQQRCSHKHSKGRTPLLPGGSHSRGRSEQVLVLFRSPDCRHHCENQRQVLSSSNSVFMH